jgi:hypothetical protein
VKLNSRKQLVRLTSPDWPISWPFFKNTFVKREQFLPFALEVRLFFVIPKEEMMEKQLPLILHMNVGLMFLKDLKILCALLQPNLFK